MFDLGPGWKGQRSGVKLRLLPLGVWGSGEGPLVNITFEPPSIGRLERWRSVGISGVAWSKEEVKTGQIHLSVIKCVDQSYTVTPLADERKHTGHTEAPHCIPVQIL